MIGIYVLCKQWHLGRNMKVYAEMNNKDKVVSFVAGVKPNNKKKPLLGQLFFPTDTQTLSSILSNRYFFS